MGFWMEIRCVNRTEKSAEGDPHTYPHERCWSLTNDGPMQEASDTQTSVLSTYRDMEKDAKDMGWKKTRNGWFCPFCSGRPIAAGDNHD